MSLWQLTLLALFGALVTFWVVGARTRVRKLRQAIVTACGQLEEILARRAAALETLLAHLREPLAAEAATLQAVALALASQQAATRALRAALDADTAAAWTAAEAALASPLARLTALLDHHPEAVRAAEVQPQVRLLADHVARIAYARQVANDAVGAYNAAITEPPTCWLARVLGWNRMAAV